MKEHKEMIIAGDGRHDSMGHSAKYCAYTVFCCTIPFIIHFSIVQVCFHFKSTSDKTKFHTEIAVHSLLKISIDGIK